MSKYEYENLNATELAELTRVQGMYAMHRGLGRKALIDLLEGRASEDDFPGDPLNEEREAMLKMQEEWPDVLNQLKCGSEFYACWDCPPARARCCAVEECEVGILEEVQRRGGQ